jgi:hypothetical protein
VRLGPIPSAAIRGAQLMNGLNQFRKGFDRIRWIEHVRARIILFL